MWPEPQYLMIWQNGDRKPCNQVHINSILINPMYELLLSKNLWGEYTKYNSQLKYFR